MLEQILVPLDMSRFAEQALPHAVELARRAHATLQLVCVRPCLTLHRNGDLEEEYLARMAAQLEPELPNAVTYRVIMDEFAPYYTTVDANRVAQILSRHAQEHDADVIVMATHGRGGVIRMWLGSVANWLVRNAARPVLLIRPQDEDFGSAISADRGIRHIVIGLDGSSTSEQVIPHALELGGVSGAHYSLVCVMSPSEWYTYEPWSARVGAMGAIPPVLTPSPAAQLLSRLDVAESLERVAARMRELGVSVRTRVLESFSPGEALVQYAAAHAADAIAVATSGRGRVHRLMLGSVTDKVVRTTEVPVLVCNIRQLASDATVEYEPSAEAVRLGTNGHLVELTNSQSGGAPA